VVSVAKGLQGAFIDIGCHSDGFVHVSRMSDEYVENPEDIVEVGKLVITRVVEIDVKKKQLTLSMQSEAMAAKERASADAKRARDAETPGDKPKRVKQERHPDAPKRTNKTKRSSDAQARRNAKRLAKKGITV